MLVTQGPILASRKTHSLVREAHESAVTVHLSKCCHRGRCAEGATASPTDEHLMCFGGKDVGKVLTQEVLNAYFKNKWK